MSSQDESGRTSHSWVAENGHDAVMKLLPDKNADVESNDNEYGRTSLSWEVQDGHERVVKLQLDKNVDVDSKRNSSRTSLSWAAHKP